MCARTSPYPASPPRRRSRPDAGRLSLLAAVALSCLFAALPQTPVAQADEFNNDMYVGNEADVQLALTQIATAIAAGRHEAALSDLLRLIRKARRWADNPPGGAEPKTLLVRLSTTEGTRFTRTDEATVKLLEHYVPLESYCLDQIQELPLAQRNAYRDRTSAEAALAYEAAKKDRDRRLMTTVADRYALTPIGLRALDDAANLAFEAGDFVVAADYWERFWLLNEAAFLADLRLNGRVLKLAQAYRAMGNRYAFREEVARRIARRLSGISLTLGHERVRVDELFKPGGLDRVFASERPLAETPGWPMLSGNPERNRVFASFSSLGTAYPPIDLSDYFKNPVTRQRGSYYYGNSSEKTLAPYNLVNYGPITIDGTLVLHGPRDGHLIQLPESRAATGSAFRRVPFSIVPFLQRAQDNGDNQGFYYYRNRQQPQYYQPAAAHGTVVCIFDPSASDPTDRRRTTTSGNSNVVGAFDARAEGKLLWYQPNRTLDPDNRYYHVLKTLKFGTAPVIAGDTVYLTGTHAANREMRYYAVAFDLKTGAVRWLTKLAAQLSDSPAFGRARAQGLDAAPPTVAGGLLFIATNGGAVAALDRTTGAIRWLVKYRRTTLAVRYNAPPTPSHWYPNPPVASHGNLYVTPTDSDRLFVFDLRTGELWRQFPEGASRVPEEVSDMEFVLGVLGDRLFLQGRKRLYWIDLTDDLTDRQREAEREGLALRFSIYKSVDFDSTASGATAVTGRGVLTRDAVVIPTTKGLRLYDPRTGKLTRELIPWPTALRPEQNDLTGHLFVFEVPDTVSRPGDPNRYPTTHRRPGEPAPLPAAHAGADAPPVTVNKRLFLAIANAKKLYLIEAK